MGAIPHANGGVLLAPLNLPAYHSYAVEVAAPASTYAESTRRLGVYLRDVFVENANARNFLNGHERTKQEE